MRTLRHAERRIRRAARVRPGERWQYGIGMDWIGKLVEAVSANRWKSISGEPLRALGMEDSGFLIGSAQKRRVATFYNRKADGSLEQRLRDAQRPEFFMGGGGAFSTRATT